MRQVTDWVYSRTELRFATAQMDKYGAEYEIRERRGRFAVFCESAEKIRREYENRKIKDSMLVEIVAMRRSGATYRAISEKFKVHRQTIYAMLKSGRVK